MDAKFCRLHIRWKQRLCRSRVDTAGVICLCEYFTAPNFWVLYLPHLEHAGIRLCAHLDRQDLLTACSESDTSGRPQVDQLGGDADWQRSGVGWMEQTFIVGCYHAEKRNSRLQLCVRRMRAVFEFGLATGGSQSCRMIRKSRSKLSSQMPIGLHNPQQ